MRVLEMGGWILALVALCARAAGAGELFEVRTWHAPVFEKAQKKQKRAEAQVPQGVLVEVTDPAPHPTAFHEVSGETVAVRVSGHLQGQMFLGDLRKRELGGCAPPREQLAGLAYGGLPAKERDYCAAALRISVLSADPGACAVVLAAPGDLPCSGELLFARGGGATWAIVGRLRTDRVPRLYVRPLRGEPLLLSEEHFARGPRSGRWFRAYRWSGGSPERILDVEAARVDSSGDPVVILQTDLAPAGDGAEWDLERTGFSERVGLDGRSRGREPIRERYRLVRGRFRVEAPPGGRP